jgi:subfamily B ATP-binding cassette protein HlyB/CyaB
VALQRDHFVWGLGAMCQLHRVPFDPKLVLQQFPPPYSVERFLHAAKTFGFRAGISKVSRERLTRLRLPCLVALAPQAAPANDKANDSANDALTGVPAPASAERGLALVFKFEDEQVLLVEPASRSPQTLDADAFAARFLGEAIRFAPADRELRDPDAAESQPRRFGFRWFVPELLKHKRVWRDVLLASLVIQLLGLATPLFTQLVVDKVVVHQTVNTLIVIGVALVFSMLFNAALTWARQYLVLHTGNRVDAVLGVRVFEHLVGLPIRYFEHRPTGVIVARLAAVESIREFVAGTAVTLILDLPFLSVFLAIMFWYSWQLSAIALAILAVIIGASLAVVPAIRARLNRQFLLGARNQAFLTEYTAGIETVKSLQMEPQLKTEYGQYLAAYLGAGFATRQLSNAYNVAANALEQLMTLLILVVGATIVMQNEGFTIGMLVAFQMFAARLSQPLLRLVGIWQQFQQAGIAVKRLGDIMNAPVEPYSLIPARPSDQTVEIGIEALGFRYAENLPWLYRNLNLAIRPGACVAIMGPSGCGKSTLAKLLQGFYLPEEGAIKLNGRDIRSLSANELRAFFGVVPQETVLFSGTLYENLARGNPHASFEQVVGACRFAEIHEVIDKLPHGYQTEIGEHGVGLSGGQKQRIAIARALLKRPAVLIFDEATSNLDPPTAEQFARTVNALKGKVTMLFIAHQLPKGLAVDEVVSLAAAQPIA